MKYLIQGGEPLERIKLLLSLTDISSTNIINALIAYYVVNSYDHKVINKVDKGNFSRAKKSLEKTVSIVEQIKEVD